MRRKNSLILMFVIFSGLFVSCWDNFTERAYYSANISSFVFEKQDTCPDIEKFVFNINQLEDTGLVYNLDSLPYGSVVNSLFPKLTLQSSNGKIYINDSLWNATDSIDFTQPVILKNTSYDGLYHRIYKISVNVHRVDPDSMILNKVSNGFPTDTSANKLIRLQDGNFRSFFASSTGGITAYVSSENASVWSREVVTGLSEEINLSSLCVFNSTYFVTSKSKQLYQSANGLSWTIAGDGTKIVTLFGSLNKKYSNEVSPVNLIGLAENSTGDICFARSSNGINWTIGSKINADFPVSDYALIKGSTVTNIQFYTIATGRNSSGEYCSSVWSTETGLTWVLIQNGNELKNTIGKRTGASLFYYDNYLVCFGGMNSNGEYINKLQISMDHGKVWKSAPAAWEFKKIDTGMTDVSSYVEHVEDVVNDKDREFIWLFGGSDINGVSSGVWKGHLNKMVFARR